MTIHSIELFLSEYASLLFWGVFVLFILSFWLLQKRAFKRTEQAMRIAKDSLALTRQTNQLLNKVHRTLQQNTQYLQHMSEITLEVPAPSTTSYSSEDNQKKVYVGNVDYHANENDLAQHFAAYGEIQEVNIPVNRRTGRAKGYGFITFVSEDAAVDAMALDGSQFKGRKIQVNAAKEKVTE